MRVRPTDSIAVVAVLSLLAAPQWVAAQTALDERQQYVATIVTGEIQVLTGPVTNHCGIYTLPAGFDGPPAADHEVVKRALRCVLDAQRRGRPAWAIWQVAGVDAILFDGLAASAVSAVHVVVGEGSDARVRMTPCLRPRVEKDASIACGPAGRPLTPDDLSKALRGLKRDLDLTSGLPREVIASLVAPAAATSSEADHVADPLEHAVGAAQRAVHAAGHTQWPRCPRHFTHALIYREGWWYCEREAAFVAEVGRVWRVVPRMKRP